jgi:O-antigen/teichoic acid export membrane protein
MHDLRDRTFRAGIASITGRAVIILLRVISIMILGRLLTPHDYGLAAMVTSFTGFLMVFGGFGLQQAAIQGQSMTEERASTLFWINVVLGGGLTLVGFAFAPIVGAFYHEPQLVLATCVVSIAFLFIGAGVQYRVLLTRQMRLGVAASIDVIAALIATAITIAMAFAGLQYWALLSALITVPIITTLGMWMVTGWLPGRPKRGTGVRSLMVFGGTMTLNAIVGYIAANFEKFLIGRSWGADSIGIYNRAQTLLMFPVENLNITFGEVAFAALSRAREDAERMKRYFLKAYTLLVSLMAPLSTICMLFPHDITAVMLGPNRTEAAEILRFLAPTVLALALAHPMSWLISSLGLVQRGLKIALVSASLTVVAIPIGLPYGPAGVAIAYSTVAVLRAIPMAAWAIHGTQFRLTEILAVLQAPLLACLAGAVAGFGAHLLFGATLPLLIRLFMEIALFGGAYAATLLLFREHRTLCIDLFRWWRAVPA